MIAKRSRVVSALRWILGLLSVIATVVIASAGSQLATPALVAVTAVAVIVGVLIPRLETESFERRLLTEARITIQLRAAYTGLVYDHGFDPLQLRLHYFRPQWRSQWGWPPITEKLVRASFFSLNSGIGLSAIEWPRDVGLVGKVWKRNDIRGEAMNLQIALPADRAGWDKLEPAVRQGLTWSQIQQVAHTQAAFAVAAREFDVSGDTVGVLSADTVVTDLPKFTPKVKAFLHQAAVSAANAAAVK